MIDYALLNLYSQLRSQNNANQSRNNNFSYFLIRLNQQIGQLLLNKQVLPAVILLAIGSFE